MNKFKLLFPIIFLTPMIALAEVQNTYHVVIGIEDVKFVKKDPITEPIPPEEDLTATSCRGLLNKTPTLSNGVHKIIYNGSEVPVYCDMSGGGWTLAGTGIANSTAGWSNPNGVGTSPSLNSTYRLPDQIINSIPKSIYKTIAFGRYAGTRYASGSCTYSSVSMASGVCLQTYSNEDLTAGLRQGVARSEVGGISDWVSSANSVIIATQYFGSIASHGWGAGNGNPNYAGTGIAGDTSTIQIWIK